MNRLSTPARMPRVIAYGGGSEENRLELIALFEYLDVVSECFVLELNCFNSSCYKHMLHFCYDRQIAISCINYLWLIKKIA